MNPAKRMTRQALTWKRTAAVITFLAGSYAAAAQPTTLAAYQDLAVGCLGEAPDTVGVFRLDAPEDMPYLRTALTEKWRRDGRQIFLSDSSRAIAQLPSLSYLVEHAAVTYRRAGRSRLRRTVDLSLTYSLTTSNGRLLREDRCSDTFSDTVRRSDRSTLESPAFPETQADLPRAGWLHRYLEPALLAAATAITVYLFFNLRSERVSE